MIFCIVHYNTPEMITCEISNILKFHNDAEIVVFDNSDKKPFKNQSLFKNVKYIDNTKGQIIDFNKELLKYPNKTTGEQKASGCNFGSAKHSMSIQWLIDNIDAPFILCDSDILLKKAIDFIDETKICISDIAHIHGNVYRITPFICYLNAPLIKRLNMKFFDPKRMHSLNGLGSLFWYDTGASFYEDLAKHKNLKIHKRIKNDDYILHCGGGSWRKNYKLFLHTYKDLWINETV